MNLSFLQRLSAETPPFWRRVQIIFLVLSAIIAYAMKFTFIPQQVCLVLAGVFGGVAFVAQCAVQDTAIIKEAIADPLSLVDNLATISSQVSQLHAAVTSQTPASLQDIRAVIADTVPAAAPVVNVAEAAGAATVVQITPQTPPVAQVVVPDTSQASTAPQAPVQ